MITPNLHESLRTSPQFWTDPEADKLARSVFYEALRLYPIVGLTQISPLDRSHTY